jgi:hypothetical protein
MKVVLYIEKRDFDTFFQWVNRLNTGVLTSCPVKYQNTPRGLTEALQLSIDPEMFNLIKDAEEDLKSLHEKYGDIELSFEPLSASWEMRTISDILRNAKRYDMQCEVVYAALYAMQTVPQITPGEAMIIAERELINQQKQE